MKSVFIDGSDTRPEIKLNAEKNLIEVTGRSYHEDTFAVYNEVLDWIDNFLQTPEKTVTLNFKLIYYNTSSARVYHQIFTKFKKYCRSNNGIVTVNWFYHEIDEDLLECGEEYQEEHPELTFNFIAC